jgi:hypothetical protein
VHANQTCALWQVCKGRDGFFGRDIKTTTCRTDGGAPQSGDVINPIIKYYEPVPIYKQAQKDQLKKNCPQFNPDDLNCCNDDQAEILGNQIYLTLSI